MKDRSTLAVSQLEKFKAFLLSKGYEIEENKGSYEVLRARKSGKKYPVIVYKRLATNHGTELKHLTVLARDMALVREFIREKRK